MNGKKRFEEKGMTLLEVAIALAIFSMGLVFLIKADQIAKNYAIQSEERQQAVYAEYGELGSWINGVPTDSSLMIGNRTYTINIDVNSSETKSSSITINGVTKTFSLEYGTVSASLPGSPFNSSLPKLEGCRIVMQP
jgi:prepilin-type N-terminal cleavage/methylation domain-containing protein